MKTLKIHLWVTVLLVGALTACSVVQPIAGDVAIRLMTKKESDFNNMSVAIYAINNAEPIDKIAYTREQKNRWKPGENAIGILTSNPTGIGLLSFDGTVTVNGTPADRMSAQLVHFFPAGETYTSRVRFENASGESYEIDVDIPPSVRITAINGATSDFSLDLSEPVELNIEFDPSLTGKHATLSLVSNTGVGVTRLYNEVASFRLAPTVRIPAAAFRSPKTAGGFTLTGKSGVIFAEDGYLQIKVEQIHHPEQRAGFVNFKIQQESYDTVPVSITGQPSDVRHSLFGHDKRTFPDAGDYHYSWSVLNAFRSPPLSNSPTRIAVASLSVSATLFRQETETSTTQVPAGTRHTTITTTFRFPQLDDAYWEQFLANIYADVTGKLSAAGLTVIPVESVVATPVYSEFYDIPEGNTEVLFRKSYKNTKRLVPSSLGELFTGEMNTAGFFPELTRTARLAQQAGVDAYLSMDLNFQVAGGPDNSVVLLPNLNYTVSGRMLNANGGVDEFARGIVRGPGIPFSEADFQDLNGLDRVAQRARLIELFSATLDQIAVAQESMGVQEIWTLVR